MRRTIALLILGLVGLTSLSGCPGGVLQVSQLTNTLETPSTLFPPDDSAESPDVPPGGTDEIDQFLASLPGEDASVDANALMVQLQGDPQFSDVELTEDGNVCYTRADGIPVVVLFRDIEVTDVPNAKWRSTAERYGFEGYAQYEVPSARAAWLLEGPWLGTSSVDHIETWLSECNYAVRSQHNADLATLRGIQNAAVLYFDTHGCVCPGRKGGDPYYAACTVDEFRPGSYKPPEYPPADESKPLVIVMRFEVQSKWYKYWAITDHFVRRHTSFASDALVYMSACYSQAPKASGFRSACWDKGAGTYLGWTDGVHAGDAMAAVILFFDRALGANAEVPCFWCPTGTPNLLPPLLDPPLRPLGLTQTTWSMMNPKHWDANNLPYFAALYKKDQKTPAVYTELKVTGRRRSDGADDSHTTGALRPVIFRLEIDEAKDQLTIYSEPAPLPGCFGTRKEGRRIEVGGRDLTDNIESWSQDRIVIHDLPRDACGPVQVFVNDIPSNTRWIAAWKNVEIKEEYVGSGTLHISRTWTFPIIRADVMTARADERIQPLAHTYWAIPAGNAQFSWDAGGYDMYEGARIEVQKLSTQEPVYSPMGYPDGEKPLDEFSCTMHLLQNTSGEQVLKFALGLNIPDAYRWMIQYPEGPVKLTDPIPFKSITVEVPAPNFVISPGDQTETFVTLTPNAPIGERVLSWSVDEHVALPPDPNAAR